MESEKVKEIKKALKNCQKNNCLDCPYFIDEKRCRANDLLLDTITLINELESENERLSKELDSEWKDRRKAEEDLHKAQWNYKIGLGQSQSANKKLKDQIAELEKEKTEQLKQFAEMLKEKVYDSFGDKVIWYNDIDETLKEFIGESK